MNPIVNMNSYTPCLYIIVAHTKERQDDPKHTYICIHVYMTLTYGDKKNGFYKYFKFTFALEFSLRS